jgi:hypothetical protein
MFVFQTTQKGLLMSKTRKVLTDSDYAKLAPVAPGVPRFYFKLGPKGGLVSDDTDADYHYAPTGRFGGVSLPQARFRATTEMVDHPRPQ